MSLKDEPCQDRDEECDDLPWTSGVDDDELSNEARVQQSRRKETDLAFLYEAMCKVNGLEGPFLVFEKSNSRSFHQELISYLGFEEIPYKRIPALVEAVLIDTDGSEAYAGNVYEHGRSSRYIDNFSDLFNLLAQLHLNGKKIVKFGLPNGRLVYGQHDVLILTDEEGIEYVLKMTISKDRRDREIQIMQDLVNVDGVPKIVTAGEMSTCDDYGIPKILYYSVITCFSGYSSLERARKEDRLNLSGSRLLRIVAKLLKILAKIHRAGWIHGDISPNNVLSQDSTPEDIAVIDFGSAYKTDEELFGDFTPGFASPECLVSEECEQETPDNNPRTTDIYSVGMILVYLLCNGNFSKGVSSLDRREHVSAVESLMLQVEGQLATVANFEDVGIQRRICAVLKKALAVNSKDRYQTAERMSAAVERIKI